MKSFSLPTSNDPVFIIAEIGKNFIETEEERSTEEYLENAKRLIDLAREAGADAVKFQTHVVEDEQLPVHIVSPHFTGADRYAWVSRNEQATPAEFFVALKQHAEAQGLVFFSTPMSRKAAQKLNAIGMPLWKIGSGDIHDYVLLDYVASTGLPVIISTGMTSLAELDATVTYLKERHVPTGILYCVSQYPAPAEAFNLATIERFRERYPHASVGFSDHSLGHEVALAAVKVGARTIEKHFSRSRDLWGADHKTSMTPEEFRAMVDAVRGGAYEEVDATPYWGNRDRELEGAESAFRPYFNKTLVAGRDARTGETLASEDIYAMRPRIAGGSFGSERFHDIVGRTLSRPVSRYQPFTDEDFL